MYSPPQSDSRPLVFRKSSYSNPQNCVEVAEFHVGAAVRDSMNPGQGHLSLPATEWVAFLEAVKRAGL
ncbi:DUF397 domain-containing protein [Nocardiopsis sediminis]|uniref:DUF397 domain-containing protein n=1 Tax=Nocardiopsis sediminis TaxID=1778267 RepID=A0ABV8FQR0_9ACTN